MNNCDYLRSILKDIDKQELIEEIIILNAYIDTKTTARLANPHSHNRYSTFSRVQLLINDLDKQSDERIIKLITQMDEFSVSNHKQISPEIMSLRDKIIERIRK